MIVFYFLSQIWDLADPDGKGFLDKQVEQNSRRSALLIACGRTLDLDLVFSLMFLFVGVLCRSEAGGLCTERSGGLTHKSESHNPPSKIRTC